MAFVDLAKVTETLISLLETAMLQSAAWPGGSNSVSPLPPDLMPGDTRLGLYLYHVTEDAHFKNEAGAVPVGGPKREKPLGLNLFYQLTVAAGAVDTDALRAQTLLGIAMRVLNDYAIINDDTVIAGTSTRILEDRGLEGRQNRLRITLRPVPPDDAVDYWTAGNAPLRLAAYYQVSVVLLEPEPVTFGAGPVLTYQTGVFALAAPHLVSSRSRRSVVVGNEASTRVVAVSPAQVTLPSSSAPDGDFELHGSQLSGDGTALRFRGDYGVFDVDAQLWGVVASPEQVFARVASSMGPIPTMPGTWSASVLVRRTTTLGATEQTLSHPSNETPILIAPRLDATSATGPTLGNVSRSVPFTLTGWRFQGSEVLPAPGPVTPYAIAADPNDPRAVRLLIGGIALNRVVAAPGAPGEYQIVDETTLSARLPDVLPVASLQPVQVWVNGAASTPQWLRVDP